MNVQAVDLSDEIRDGIDPRFDLAPVIFRGPIAREFLSRVELNTLRPICDRFPIRPAGRVDALTQLCKLRVRVVHIKSAYRCRIHWLCPLPVGETLRRDSSADKADRGYRTMV